MAKIARNDLEAEEDRKYIVALIQRGGPDVSAVEVWRLLNDRRARTYRQAALAAGKSKEEAEEAGRQARITVQTVRRDIRILIGRAQEAGTAGAAVFLDDQIDAVRDEIEATHLMDEEIRRDLERSRETRWSRTLGVLAKREDGSGDYKTIPTEVTRFVREEGAAAAALYGRLQENSRRRSVLRAEERLLRGIRQYVPDAEADEEQTLAEVVMDLDDPERARAAALRLLRRELRELESAAMLPMGAEVVALERMRIQGLESKIRSLRDYVRLPEDIEGPLRSFEVSFEEAAPRQLPPAPPEIEGGGESDAP